MRTLSHRFIFALKEYEMPSISIIIGTSGWTSEQVAAELNSTTQGNISVKACQNGWKYDTSSYQSSIVTEVGSHWNGTVLNYCYSV